MGASSSTFENDIETSVSKIFGNNVHVEDATAKNDMENLSFAPLEHQYLRHHPVIEDAPEYETFHYSPQEMQQHHQLNGTDDDDNYYSSPAPEYLTGGSPRVQLYNDNYNAADYLNVADSPGIKVNFYSYKSGGMNLSSNKMCAKYVHVLMVEGFDKNGGKDNVKKYMVLYKAALKGDWGRAREIFKVDPDAITARITINNDTALHVAAAAEHVTFVEKLVKLMPPEALELKNKDGETPLHVAGAAGITKAAKAMVKKNHNLTQIRDNNDWVPLLTAVYFVSDERKDMVEYLCTVTRDEHPSPFVGVSGGNLICLTTGSSLFDVALYLVQRFPALATEEHKTGYCALEVLARRPDAFHSGISHQLRSWQRFIYPFIPVEDPLESSRYISRSCSRGRPMTKFFSLRHLTQVIPGIKRVYNQKLMHKQALALVKCICIQLSLMSSSEILEYFSKSSMLTAAARYGIVEIVAECIQTFPDIIWHKMKNRTIFGQAILHRQEKIFNLICGLNGQKKKLASFKDDESNNTILHLVAKLAPPHRLNSVSGAALQMQRELQWFKEVESIALQKHKQKKNNDKKTGRVLFTEEHKDLKEKGERWMKKTAHSCMLVATLITTVVFSAAVAVLGGNASDIHSPKDGIPFVNTTSFLVFAMADALALFFSLTSVLLFFIILTSRYAEEDFLESLQKKLIIGLLTLFTSVATMVVSFTASLSVILGDKLKWIVIPVVLIVCLPVTVFTSVQFIPMFFGIWNSTCGPSIFRRKSQYMHWNY